ncbi:SHOCT domain-containing protein [Clostridium beijerinckii]|nr:SHOCT domain-containing protein [Clostridium beijerinckii]MBF7811938.1 SHOCT domain-containing protein [Clostridium beijerinckii]
MALRQACQNLDGFNINDFDETLKILYLKAGVSLFSWGENITVTVASCDNGNSEISILSTPKTGVMFGGTVDMGKNRKNINTIMSALSEELKNYVQVTKKSTSTESVADEIRKLAELKEQGILTEDEFSSKKKQLLGL